MKTIIAGSRTFSDDCVMADSMKMLDWVPTEIVSGGASGADSCGERWASIHELQVKTFLPDWNQHGKSAGIVRNVEMALYADALVAFWDGQSRGTKHMIDYSNKQGLKVKVFTV